MIGTENIWLRVAKISKHFGPVIALESVDASIRLGEVLALVGDNGAGKSTLVKLLSGAYLPSAGEIAIDRNPVNSVAPRHFAARRNECPCSHGLRLFWPRPSPKPP